MAAPREIQVTFVSGKDLQNVNWRYGPIKPYAVVWVDPNSKLATTVDEKGDTYPTWNSTLVIPLFCPINDDTNLYVDVIHAGNEEKTKPLIGSAKLNLRDVLKDSGRYGEYEKSLKLKRPSGKPQGKVDVKVLIRALGYHVPDQSRAIPSYGYPQSAPYGAPQPVPYGAHPSTPYGAYPPASCGSLSGYSYPYAQQPLQQPQNPYYPFAQQGGYSYNAYNYNAQPQPQPASYGAPTGHGYGHGQTQAPFGATATTVGCYYEDNNNKKKKKKKFGGMEAGMAMGAAMGVGEGALGGLAIAEGLDATRGDDDGDNQLM
ncbi:hypothetical protein ES319_A11G012100v1 [Gossypium barbadense]|uniref:C2 domain-containing protein n=1 Tax=Gossypium barbadense TaxID=3634 RepID=A0A2P5W544_GOSBA|nr:hypothetical protein ES319_A11G012100v1 [Gossypium barbadense]PPR86178.1 hypothetical protein GOBAR_AA34513 [Gossypium barbadense]